MTHALEQAYSPPSISVLMSTYAKEKASNLEAALESLWTQTELPDEVVLVVDGPVGAEQEDVVARFAARGGVPELVVVSLEVNQGLAKALNAGLERCRGTYIARMDSDDLCQPDRLAVQVAYAQRHPDTDVICSWSDEFFDDGTKSRLKVAPVGHEAVVRALKWRNVIHHPTVFLKADTLRAVGGYRAKYGLLEDYDLFVRLAVHGARFHIIPKVLVHIRSSMDQSKRRGGLRYCANEVRFRAACFRAGFLSAGEFVLVTGMYTAFRLVSGGVRKRLYALTRTEVTAADRAAGADQGNPRHDDPAVTSRDEAQAVAARGGEAAAEFLRREPDPAPAPPRRRPMRTARHVA
jgi:glycosyltransferase involved in cell wall biosynthesis